MAMNRPTKVGPVTRVLPAAQAMGNDNNNTNNSHPLSTVNEAESEEDCDASYNAMTMKKEQQKQQRQRRQQLSIPCTPSNLTVPPSGCSNDSDLCDRLWSNPETRTQVFKRRSAVHGLSPNTGLSIGAVM